MFIQIYNSLIRILYPLVIKRYINKRKENGKEDVAASTNASAVRKNLVKTEN